MLHKSTFKFCSNRKIADLPCLSLVGHHIFSVLCSLEAAVLLPLPHGKPLEWFCTEAALHDGCNMQKLLSKCSTFQSMIHMAAIRAKSLKRLEFDRLTSLGRDENSRFLLTPSLPQYTWRAALNFGVCHMCLISKCEVVSSLPSGTQTDVVKTFKELSSMLIFPFSSRRDFIFTLSWSLQMLEGR